MSDPHEILSVRDNTQAKLEDEIEISNRIERDTPAPGLRKSHHVSTNNDNILEKQPKIQSTGTPQMHNDKYLVDRVVLHATQKWHYNI